MSIKKNDGRQPRVCAMVDFTYDDMSALDGSLEDAVEAPQNAVVVGGMVDITTAFNSATSDTLTVGDSDDDDRYITGLNAQTTGVTAFTIDGHKYANQSNIGIGITGAGAAPTAGAGTLYVEYVVTSRAKFTQG